MIDTLTACRQITVYLSALCHKGARRIYTIDTTFNKKRREEYIEKVFENLLSFLSIFRWVLGKYKFKRLLEGVYIVFGHVKKIKCRFHQ
ncbi:hypothetical protein A4F89_02990 [Polynucleobacter asymbioticus]|jgi:hypothetical protein|uniref:Uncharacterized protein n=1 Tax=Polynucleobacter asymbioticus TaxID=576611 RepID=A0AAC9IXE3_9BURK|nr:hypothetical protein A4F89_02990 [Polynucleobacter asymbioticus]APC00662.1 hypothetical protein AOC25_02995 [Polynucleobacter asymbioticus]